MTNTLRTALRCGWLLVLMAICFLGASGVGGADLRPFVAGEILVSVRAGTPRTQADQLAGGINGTVINVFGSLDWEKKTETYHFRITGNVVGDDVTLAAVAKLKADASVVWAGPNKIDRWLDTPNDPQFPQQWHLPDMKMPSAWGIEKGNSRVIIAILDSGCDVTHPDLTARIHPAYRNFFPGLNATDMTDNAPHGTLVLGSAGATTNNNLGVAGVTWQGVRMLPLKVGDAFGAIQSAQILEMQYAQLRGVNVINMSFGGQDFDDAPDLLNPRNALLLSLARSGVVFCIAAGNSGPSSPPIAPANMAEAHVNIITVAASGRNDLLTVFSSVRRYTTIAAPGEDVLTTTPGGTYGAASGTSLASPLVAGVAGLLLSVPGVRPEEVRSVITSTARQPATQRPLPIPNPEYGYGIVDAFAALQRVTPAAGVGVLGQAVRDP